MEDKFCRTQKILIIGHPGAGKTTLAVRMGAILGLPVIHLDQQFWQPGWQESPREEWRERIREMTKGERWIIDGTYDNSLDLRLPHADTVVFLDFDTGLCLWRVLKRMMLGFGRVRPDMADGCHEKVDWSFIKFVWQYRKIRRPRIMAALKEYVAEDNIIRLITSSEVDRFVQHLIREAIP